MKIKPFILGLTLLSLFLFSYLFVAYAVDEAVDEAVDGAVDEAVDGAVDGEIEETEANYFSDVSEYHENFEAIYFLYNVDFIEGYVVEGQDLREYRPNQNINRAEFLTLLFEGAGNATYAEYESCFSDVPAGEWYTTFICQAKEEGHIHGYPDGTFRPEQTINEVEVLKILGEVSEWELDDVSEGEEWYQPYLDVASAQNVAPDKAVDADMTRGDVAEMIFRLISIGTFETESYDESRVPEMFDLYDIPYDETFFDLIPCCCSDIETGQCFMLTETNCSLSGVDMTPYGYNSCSPDACEAQRNKTQEDDGDGGDSGDGASYDGSISASVSQNGPKSANGMSKITITVNLTGDEGQALSGRNLEGIVMKPHDISRIDFVDKGDGVYELDLNSYWSGTYSVYIKDKTSGDVFHTDVVFEALGIDNVEILDVLEPYETDDHRAYVTASANDVYGNVVEDETLSFTTDLGSVVSAEYDEEYGYWVGVVDSDSYGDANITVSVEDVPTISETVTVAFDTVYLGVPDGVTIGDNFVVPVYVNMGTYGSLGSYEIRIMDTPGHRDFITAVDGDTSDTFDAPMIAMVGNTIILSATSNTGNTTDQYLHVANLQYGATIVGTSTIYVEDAVITNTAEEVLDPKLTCPENPPEITVKDKKNICLDIYTLEGADNSSYLDVSVDVTYAQTIFNDAADNCKCSHYVAFLLTHKTISSEEWKTYAGFHGTDINAENDVLEEDEMHEVADMISEPDGCIQIFYVPQLGVSDEQAGTGATIGWTAIGGTTADYIAVDNSRDDDDITLAHELLHMLSDCDVVDGDANASASEKATAHAQGADQEGNLMNYDHPGTDITKNQCDLVKWENY